MSLNERTLLVCIWLAASTAFGAPAPWPALPATPPIPADNPQSAEKIHLGKELFFDARLSKDGTISCNSCHSVMGSGTDNRPNAVGIGGQHGNRSAPTVWNAAFLSVQFWDGRAPTLEAQAKGPLTNPIEMGMPSEAAVIARVKKIPGYVDEFGKVFPGDNSVDIDNLARAIASYERTLVTPNSPYDRWVGGETMALSPAAERGMMTAVSVGCIDCHSGPAMAGPTQPSGQGNFEVFPTFQNSAFVLKYHFLDDNGLGAQTHQPRDNHRWRIPTWRNIALTAPYFHNGAVATLDEAVRVMGETQLGTKLNEGQVSDIVEFLNALTGEFPEQSLPHLPPTPDGTSLD